jgi:hypothetical protein
MEKLKGYLGVGWTIGGVGLFVLMIGYYLFKAEQLWIGHGLTSVSTLCTEDEMPQPPPPV